jgi:hypothetical protein
MLVTEKNTKKSLKTRGIVILDTDLFSLNTWPGIAHKAGLTTLGIGPSVIKPYLDNFLNTAKGQAFINSCKEFDIGIEHELHTLSELLPRNLFEKDPKMFRVNEDGRRAADFNCCVHSKQAIEIISENAYKFAPQLISTTGRYFFWIDDARCMCRCPKCRVYSDSDQALILENYMLKAIRKFNPNAQLAHLAYVHTLNAPKQVKPDKGIFLEFAPIHRSFELPLSCSEAHQEGQTITHGEVLEKLDANLDVFDRDTAQILEYWLDVSRFSKWKQPAVELPWNEEVFLSDIQTYVNKGIRNISSYGAWINTEYLKTYPMPPIEKYGTGLAQKFVVQ